MNIKMVKDLNNLWSMEVHMDYMPAVIMEELIEINGAHYHYGENADGIVKFGISYDDKIMGHKPGYMWSSRCGVFNTMFGKSCIEVTVCVPNIYGDITRYGFFYMTVDKAMELMPDDFHISMFRDCDEDVFFFIHDNEPNEVWGYEYMFQMLRH